MNKEEYESPYCDICGTCGYIGCCGIRNFISEHIQGKTNCKNENLIISELIDLCDYKDQVFEENKQLKNIINELEWKPIDEYFKNKENYDWVLVKYYDKYNFECIPSVAEWRFDKWYLKDNEKSLQDFEVKYFFDMQQLDKLKELKEKKK